MIAMVLGLMILAGVVQLFIASRQTYQTTDAVARVQENGRFAVDMLRPSLREAQTGGFCAGAMAITNHLDLADALAQQLFLANRPMFGWEFDGTGRGDEYEITDLEPPTDHDDWEGPSDLPEALRGEVVAGSDVIAVRNLEVIDCLEATGTAGAVIDVDAAAGCDIPQCQLLLVTNCRSGADLFQKANAGMDDISKVGGTCSDPGNLAAGSDLNWSTSYGVDTQFYRYRTRFYYIGFNADRNEPGLYRADSVDGTDSVDIEEMVEGIENMQVLYGISLPADQGGDGQSVDFWLTADEVENWELVIALRTTMLVRSQENAGQDEIEQVFDLAGAEITAGTDARLRQQFSTTVALRNRVLVN
jgi:type IV pilus assembly protein PilW